ncbi:hypothetical protein NE865_00539 [Phthorimaea operculella]|nr:hypothetical protein NE865_00539 [Phthorimaea operculella]
MKELSNKVRLQQAGSLVLYWWGIRILLESSINISSRCADSGLNSESHLLAVSPEENQNVDELNDKICSVVTQTTRKHIGGMRPPSEAKLTPETLLLLSQRREMTNSNTTDLRERNTINKEIKKAIRTDIRAYNTRTIEKTIQDNRGPKVFRKKLNKDKMEINKLTNSAGNIVMDRDGIVRIVEEFYGNLYTSKAAEPDSLDAADPRAVPLERYEDSDLPLITVDEVRKLAKFSSLKKRLSLSTTLPTGLPRFSRYLQTTVQSLPVNSIRGLDPSGRSDDPDPPHAPGHAQLQIRGHQRLAKVLAAAHQTPEGRGPRLLYVPDQYQHDEEADRLCRCFRLWYPPGRRPDDPDPPHAAGHLQLEIRGHQRLAKVLAAAHQTPEGRGPRLLHVPDQHQHYEEADRLCGCFSENSEPAGDKKSTDRQFCMGAPIYFFIFRPMFLGESCSLSPAAVESTNSHNHTTSIDAMRRFARKIVMQIWRLIRRKYFSLFFVCGLAIYCTHLYKTKRDIRYYYVFNEGCKIPFMEIYDEELENFSYDPYHFVKTCSNFSLLRNNQTHIWITADSKNSVVRETVSCCYQPFERPNTIENITAPEKDTKVQYEPCRNFSNCVEVSSEFAKVSCVFKFQNGTSQNYVQYFIFTPVKYKTTNPEDKQKYSSRLNPGYNVIILGFNGMSRMNFYRTMVRTFDYLASKGSKEMQGYHRVAENSFVDMMPMLLGLKETEMRHICWPHLEAHYDNCPFIWNLYKNASYFTALGDDYSRLSLFNFNRHGFIRTPTDYYLYQFMREALGQDESEGKCNECMGHQFTFQVFLDYIGNLTRTLRHLKLFGFFWETCMSHQIHTTPTLMDNGYFNLLKNMESSGYLNDTMLIITSNSGMRWGRIRFSKRGRLEERLPVMQILAPPKFRKKYKVAFENLIENMYKLTSPFDVYETLKDLANLSTIEDENIKIRSNSPYGQNRGISLFLPIPSNRTCADLDIAAHQCVCDRIGKNLKTNSTQALDAAEYLVDYLNNLVAENEYCATLQLQSILQMTKFMTRASEDFALVAVFSPASIQQSSITNFIEFEATLQYNGSWHLVEVHRTNALGYESRCLPRGHKHRPFCYCYPENFDPLV